MDCYIRIMPEFRDMVVNKLRKAAVECRLVPGSAPLPALLENSADILENEPIVNEGDIEEVLDAIESKGDQNPTD